MDEPIIVKAFSFVTVFPPVVTTTFQLPVGFPDRGSVQVICVGDTTVTPEATISVSPVLESFTVAGDTKLVPDRFVIVTGPEFGAVEGVIEPKLFFS